MKKLVLISLIAVLSVPAIGKADDAKGRIFSLADIDASQNLSRQEFKNYINFLAKEGRSGAKLVRAFGLYSTAWKTVNINGDGVVSRDEISSAAAEHKQVPSSGAYTQAQIKRSHKTGRNVN